MSKKKQISIEDDVMNRINSGEVKMKPRWYFIAGSILMFGSVVALALVSIYLINLALFALKPHYGPGAGFRLEAMIAGFPWWAPLLAISGIFLAVWLLKKYDFSYRKNFLLIILSFVLAVIMGAFLMDALGFNDYFSKRGPMKGFYRQVENKQDSDFTPKGRGQGRGQNYKQDQIENSQNN
jgi:hypothetical protein